MAADFDRSSEAAHLLISEHARLDDERFRGVQATIEATLNVIRAGQITIDKQISNSESTVERLHSRIDKLLYGCLFSALSAMGSLMMVYIK